MRKRGKYIRVCESCKKEQLVRSDQLGRICADCQHERSKNRLLEWAIENPEKRALACKGSTKHGLHGSRIYRIHKSMLQRCGQTSCRHKWAMYYEDKGIRVCDEWINLESFAKWALESGYSDDLSIDRIDGSLGYSSNNCRWVTRKEQQANRSNSRSVRWSSQSDCCVECGTFEREHVSFGMCSACYQKARKKKKTSQVPVVNDSQI